VPLVEDPSRIPALAAELGRSALHDQLVLERIAAAPPGDREEQLRRLAGEAREGRLVPGVAAVVTFLRGSCERIEGAEDLFEDSLRPELDVAAFSRAAFDRVVAREIGRGRAAAVAALELEAWRRHPELPQLRLDAAGALVSASDFDAADRELAAVATEAAGDRSTAAQERRATAELGRAWIALLHRGPDSLAAARAAAERAVRWPRPLLAQEDTLRVVELRAAFLLAFAKAIEGASARDELARAIERTPIDVDRCFLDDAWFGPFGPAPMTGVLRGAGLADALACTALEVADAVEATHALHGHGLSARSAEEDDSEHERLASWIFLNAAERVLVDRGDPAAALAELEPRWARLARLHLWANQELLVEARLLESRCRLHLGDAAESHRAADDAVAIATTLRASAGHEFVRRVVHDEAPPPPSARVLLRADPPYASLMTRTLIVRANVVATLSGDFAAAAQDLFEAGASWPWDEERWLKCALDLARRGRGEEARRCLACVEASTDHAYDRACVFAWLGEREPALELLREHLAWSAKTPAGRALELASMARDRDLASLHDDARFPRQ
jgi:hypothetical protein